MAEVEMSALFENKFKFSLLEGKDEQLIKIFVIYESLKQKI